MWGNTGPTVRHDPSVFHAHKNSCARRNRVHSGRAENEKMDKKRQKGLFRVKRLGEECCFELWRFSKPTLA